jgi:hypothetical protein
MGCELIGYDAPRHGAQTLQQVAKEGLGRFRAAAALYENVRHVAVLINSTPEIVQLASDADEDLIQKPLGP